MNKEPARLSRIGWVVAFLVVAILLAWAFTEFRQAEWRGGAELLEPIATVPDFSFTTQEGKSLTREDLAGKIWVADFIFTRCPDICPVMTARMAELAAKLSKVPGVKLVSVSVDPEHDTPAVLAAYASSVHADPSRWSFLTGSPRAIAEFTTRGMKQPLAMDPSGTPTHSPRFMIVDKAGVIRSYHDVSDPEVVQKLLMDIGSLLRERSSSKPVVPATSS